MCAFVPRDVFGCKLSVVCVTDLVNFSVQLHLRAQAYMNVMTFFNGNEYMIEI